LPPVFALVAARYYRHIAVMIFKTLPP